MILPYFYSAKFEKQYKKLDQRTRELIKKKILKIVKNPELGKPLHKPLQSFRSERVENRRIIYTFNTQKIKFAWIDDRGHVYD